MQERPDKTVLLAAIARFLVEDVRPALSDPRLAFRALIAANLASIVASELATDDDAIRQDLARLGTALPDVDTARPSTPEARRALLAELNVRIARRFRDADVSPAETARVAALLRESLRTKLSIDNPRFDTSLEIE